MNIWFFSGNVLEGWYQQICKTIFQLFLFPTDSDYGPVQVERKISIESHLNDHKDFIVILRRKKSNGKYPV